MTTVTFRTDAIFFGLRLAGMGQGNALFTSTSLVWFMSTGMGNVIKNLYNKWLVLIGKKH